MKPPSRLFCLTIITSCAAFVCSTVAQTAKPTPEIPDNALVTIANGIQLIFIPGDNPTVIVKSSSEDDLASGLSVAASKTLRYVDNKGNSVDPKTITSRDRLQPIYDSNPGKSLVVQTILVDRN